LSQLEHVPLPCSAFAGVAGAKRSVPHTHQPY
jgi:hypothetical protein